MRHAPRMRPTFEIPLGEAAAVAFFARLGDELRVTDCCYVGQIVKGHAVVHVRPDRRTLLSPFLNLDWDPEAQVLRGQFAPHPNVWTAFIGTYILLGLAGVAGLMYGLSELVLGRWHWSLGALPVSLALIAFVYGAAVIGQGLTVDDMFALRQFVERAARDAAPDAAAVTPRV